MSRSGMEKHLKRCQCGRKFLTTVLADRTCTECLTKEFMPGGGLPSSEYVMALRRREAAIVRRATLDGAYPLLGDDAKNSNLV